MSETQTPVAAPAEAAPEHAPVAAEKAIEGVSYQTLEQKAVNTIDFNAMGRWASATLVGGAILALELTGHAPTGTFLNYVAIPTLALLGVHTVAKNLN